MDSALVLPDAGQRRLASLMHVATIFFPLMAPVVGFAISGKNPFLRAHAVRSLKETLVLQLLIFTGMAISFAYSAINLYHHYQEGWKNFEIWPILIKTVVVWGILGIIELINIALALRWAKLASNGTWPKGYDLGTLP